MIADTSSVGARRPVSRLNAPGLPATSAVPVPVVVDEFWTSRQRAAHSLHEISYRACFKPQLPRYFIERLTQPGDHVLDPFMGRGTTLLEAALIERVPVGADANPLCAQLVAPRLAPPTLEAVAERLTRVPFAVAADMPEELLVFYHPATLREIAALRTYLIQRDRAGELDAVDGWIRMVALNRLTGHSPGFFSVYTLPPNQAVSVAAQRKINARLQQVPTQRHVPELILRKSRALLKDCSAGDRQRLALMADGTQLLTRQADRLHGILDDSVQLVVTSPPFLDTVDYVADNWLRAWFAGVDTTALRLGCFRNVADWTNYMTASLRECRRVLSPGGHVAFEVGEVRGATVNLEQHALAAGQRAGLEPVECLINTQHFTKTANCWGVTNGVKGTNSNRIVVFRKT